MSHGCCDIVWGNVEFLLLSALDCCVPAKIGPVTVNLHLFMTYCTSRFVGPKIKNSTISMDKKSSTYGTKRYKVFLLGSVLSQ